MNILLVDDSAPILRGEEKMIRQITEFPISIHTAPNGIEAMNIMKDFMPDLMILDILMPGMSGLDFLENAYLAGYRGKAILLSSYGEFSYAQKAIQLGVVDYLLKPVEEAKLIHLVRDAAHSLEESHSEVCPSNAALLRFTDYSAEDSTDFPPILNKIIKYIAHHYMEDLSLSSLAEKCNISSTYICSLFTAHLNKTFLAYLDQVRLQHAAELLADSNKTLEAIAQETGFKYANQLLRVFRKRIGITPSEFRRKYSSIE